jgi:glucose-1-phosphate cytidylyltransferase
MIWQRPPVVLLCGGLGLRQRSDGDDLPKPMRPLPDGRPLLLHVLDYYASFGLGEFVLCVGYGAPSIEALLRGSSEMTGAEITTGPGWTRLSTADRRMTLVDSGVHASKCARLADARPHVGDRGFLLGYADVLSDVDLHGLLRTHQAGCGLVTLTVTTVRSRFGLVTIGPGTLVTGFDEKPPLPAPVSAGYFACEPGLFDWLAPDLELEADVLPRLAAQRRLHAFRHGGLWLALDTYKDFAEIEALVDREGCAWLAPVSIETNVLESVNVLEAARLPLNRNGKVDRRLLADWARGAGTGLAEGSE